MQKKFRSAYADKDKEQIETDLNEWDPSLTLQSCKDECDIHQILNRHATTGILEHINQAQEQYGDYSDVQSFQEAINTVRQAENLFEALPSKVREKFGNNPAAFLDFAGNPQNAQEMVDLGLATLRVAKTDGDPATALKNDSKEAKVKEGLAPTERSAQKSTSSPS